MKKLLKQKVEAALHCLWQGDTDRSLQAIDQANSLIGDVRCLLTSAREQCETGTVQGAEMVLERLLTEL